jgi:hypothetical protein
MPTPAFPLSPALSRSRASGVLLALLVVLLGSSIVPPAASAARSVTFASTFSLASRLGEGTVYTTELTFAGSEYYGLVAPLTGLTIRLPAGTGLSDAGFPTCSKTTIEQFSPSGCPAGSLAGPVGTMHLIASFRSEKVPEEAILQPVFGPGGVLYVAMEGHAPGCSRNHHGRPLRKR